MSSSPSRDTPAGDTFVGDTFPGGTFSGGTFSGDTSPAGDGAAEAVVLRVIAGLLLRAPGEEEVRALLGAGLAAPPPGDGDHARLLGGLRPGYGPLPPYESVWRGEGRVMGETSRQVARAYAAAGARLDVPAGTPPDHVGFEVAFLAYLLHSRGEAERCGQTERAARAEAARRAFLDDHVRAWVPAWCEAVEAADPAGFYGALACLLRGYVT